MREYPLHIAAVAAYCKIPPRRAALMNLRAPDLEANAGRVGFPSALNENHIHSRSVVREPLGLGSDWRWTPGSKGRSYYLPLPPGECYFPQKEGVPDLRGPVFLCEGETAGITLAGLGYFTIASTSSDWPLRFPGDLIAGRDAVMWRDNDANGRKWEGGASAWAWTHARSLWRVVPNEMFEEKDDVRDIWTRYSWNEGDFHNFIFHRTERVKGIKWKTPPGNSLKGRGDKSDIYNALSPFDYYAHQLGSNFVRNGRYRCWNVAGHKGGDRNPSGSYTKKEDGSTVWMCHGCGKSGDIIDIAAEAGGVTAGEVMRRARKDLGGSSRMRR